MFQIGGELEAMLRAGPQEQILFRVGVADVVPKSIVYRLMAPTMELDEVLRITCREDKLERLLADLAIQRLDLVISDSPMPSHLDIKGYSQKLGECGSASLPRTRWPHSSTSPSPPACTARRC
jgi:LysR family transcriptional activator of nhaA